MHKRLILIFVLLIFASGCAPQEEVEAGELDTFAQCLAEKGVKMYGSVFCSICDREKELFGSSFQYVEEIECHPRGENPQTELCLKKDVMKTPTWIREEGGVELGRLEGFQTLETLSELSGCSVENG